MENVWQCKKKVVILQAESAVCIVEKEISNIYLIMNTIKIRRGLDIKIGGKAKESIYGTVLSKTIGIVPDDYVGFTPKIAVKEGDEVKVGSTILYDKNHPSVKVLSPVAGRVKSVERGERRKLEKVVIERGDGHEQYEELPRLEAMSDPEETAKALAELGFATLMRQRPYDIVVNPEVLPRAIFVSAFDSAPLAADYDFVLKDRINDIQAGLKVLAKIAKVYYSVRKDTFEGLKRMSGVTVSEFDGPHPAGNVGVQINHIAPVNKGETVWTVGMMTVAMIGHYAVAGELEMKNTIAVAGPMVKEPRYVEAYFGTEIGTILKDNVIEDEHVRIINGNVLTGRQASVEDYLSPMANCVNVIAEGDHEDELFGWMRPRFRKYSASRLYCSWILEKICPKMTFKFDARMLGSERAFIMSGEYDKVFPMDILPEPLVKAMITKNIDRMEQLGAYEVAPEDFALCEFVCTSKIQTQKIVREALDYLRKEVE